MECIFSSPLKGVVALTNGLNANSNLMRDSSLYKIIWLRDGVLKLEVDSIPLELHKDELVALTPLHNIKFLEISGDYMSMLFNSNFYCIFGHDNEVSCNGILFNGSAQISKLKLPPKQSEQLISLTQDFNNEYAINDSLQEEMLRIQLKKFIITCTRIAREALDLNKENERDFDLIRQFYILVDEHYKTKKQVQEYAILLNKSPKTISNIFAKYAKTTPLKVIHNRIDAQAKRLLLYTNKSAKEVAYMLGFEDIAAFSRFFAAFNSMSISEFRERVDLKKKS